jgi:hypothetical protein
MTIEIFDTIFSSGLLTAFGDPALVFAFIALAFVGMFVLLNMNIFLALAFVSVPAILMYSFLGFGSQSMIGMIILLLALMAALAFQRILSGR